MPTEFIFVHIGRDARIVELPLPAGRTGAALYAALLTTGLLDDENLRIFIDEEDNEVMKDCEEEHKGLKHGCRIHLNHCKRIEVRVHYLEKTAERKFAPGTRVRTIKQWATREFHIDSKDAPEHILQVCDSKERPSSDTPLSTLLRNCGCDVCFDLVPEKRVEG
ncbi:MAG: hypothetical protein IT167_23165 [Bryobacterales bacterium]|nr:hypothetical protein [Bryobacterales bacterium]